MQKKASPQPFTSAAEAGLYCGVGWWGKRIVPSRSLPEGRDRCRSRGRCPAGGDKVRMEEGANSAAPRSVTDPRSGGERPFPDEPGWTPAPEATADWPGMNAEGQRERRGAGTPAPTGRGTWRWPGAGECRNRMNRFLRKGGRPCCRRRKLRERSGWGPSAPADRLRRLRKPTAKPLPYRLRRR